MKRGEIYMASIERKKGSETGGKRPVIVIQNDIANKYSPVVICAPITHRLKHMDLPTHVFLKDELKFPSIIQLEQITTLDKSKLGIRICKLDHEKMKEVDNAIMVSLGLMAIIKKGEEND